MSQLVVIIQCHTVCRRCSGYGCMNGFFSRKGTFKNYPPDTRLLTMTCGGCCGAGLADKLDHLSERLDKFHEDKKNVTVHLASCITSDSDLRPACPFRNYMARIVKRQGYKLADMT